MTKHPANDFQWDEDVEVGFNSWFHGDYGPYSYRSEWFQGDVETEDLNQRKDAMINWLHSAFCAGYECALYAKLEEEQEDT